MAFGIIEWLALVTALIVAIKLVTLAINPRSWFEFSNNLFGNTKVVQLVLLILSGAILYFLLMAGLTIVQLFATILFVSFLVAAGLAPYIKPLLKAVKPKKFLTQNLNWLLLLVWVALTIWVVVELFV